jgi:hypothetical protein
MNYGYDLVLPVLKILTSEEMMGGEGIPQKNVLDPEPQISERVLPYSTNIGSLCCKIFNPLTQWEENGYKMK